MRTMMVIFFLFSVIGVMNSCDQGVEPVPVCHAGNLDTTSHTFNWTITELGDGGGSILNDVAIINDGLIYAVGELYLRDSAGQIDPQAYNVARWNGTNWSPLRIPTEAFGGSLGYYPIKAVFAFGENDIWMFSIAGSYSHWNGNDWQTKYVAERSGGGLKFWGGSSSNLYLVGTNGSISLYNGTAWQLLASGTTLPINDIWGARNPATGQWQILAIASDQSTDQGKRLLRIDNQTVTAVGDNGLSWSLNGVWFVPDCVYYVVGDGLYPSQTPGPTWTRDFSLPAYYKTSIRGNGTNDVAVVGALGLLMHYNGSTWRNYQDSLDFSGDGSFAKVDFKGNTLVAVGTRNNRAIAVIGGR